MRQLTELKKARAVTSMTNVALVSLEPASAELSGVQVMARALDAMARVDVEVLALSSSSYRQSFCFLVRGEELRPTMQALEAALALELAHGYVKPIHVAENVGLLAIVGEGMQGKPGLAGRVFTAISREQVNIIAIAQGSSELTIGIVVRRDGLEKAVRAVHRECELGRRWMASRASRWSCMKLSIACCEALAVKRTRISSTTKFPLTAVALGGEPPPAAAAAVPDGPLGPDELTLTIPVGPDGVVGNPMRIGGRCGQCGRRRGG